MEHFHLALADASRAREGLPAAIDVRPGTSFTIGRVSSTVDGEGSDVVIAPVDAPDYAKTMLSRRHAVISHHHGLPKLTDLSLNGTQVDGVGVAKDSRVTLHPQSVVICGITLQTSPWHLPQA